MILDYFAAIGFVAGALTTLALLPQLVKAARSRSVEDLSMGWLAASGVGVALWTYYGYGISSMPVLLFNAVSLVLVAAISALKLKYKYKVTV